MIPEVAVFSGTIRTFDVAVRDMVFRRIGEIVEGHASAYGVSADLEFDEGYPATINLPGNADFAAQVAAEVVGETAVSGEAEPEMGAEDFSYMIQARPGAYLFLGQGGGPDCHHPAYDFNDEIAPIGASFFARLVERAQPLG